MRTLAPLFAGTSWQVRQNPHLTQLTPSPLGSRAFLAMDTISFKSRSPDFAEAPNGVAVSKKRFNSSLLTSKLRFLGKPSDEKMKQTLKAYFNDPKNKADNAIQDKMITDLKRLYNIDITKGFLFRHLQKLVSIEFLIYEKGKYRRNPNYVEPGEPGELSGEAPGKREAIKKYFRDPNNKAEDKTQAQIGAAVNLQQSSVHYHLGLLVKEEFLLKNGLKYTLNQYYVDPDELGGEGPSSGPSDPSYTQPGNHIVEDESKVDYNPIKGFPYWYQRFHRDTRRASEEPVYIPPTVASEHPGAAQGFNQYTPSAQHSNPFDGNQDYQGYQGYQYYPPLPQ